MTSSASADISGEGYILYAFVDTFGATSETFRLGRIDSVHFGEVTRGWGVNDSMVPGHQPRTIVFAKRAFPAHMAFVAGKIVLVLVECEEFQFQNACLPFLSRLVPYSVNLGLTRRTGKQSSISTTTICPPNLRIRLLP